MSFADFPEEKQVVALLQRSLDSGRLAHAYLFSGRDLSGLERMAESLARTINCAQPPQLGRSGLALDSCDHCLSCRKIAGANHPDIQWIRPESKMRVITIDQIRSLMQSIYLKPTEAQFKVGVIVAADRLSTQAANAFLKTLEEPPSRSVLILLSIDSERILETILSRCIRLTFAADDRSRFEKAQAGWLSQFAAFATKTQKGLLVRYKLLGILMSHLAQVRAEIEESLTARSPLQKYDDVEPKLREKWEDELVAAIEAEYRRQRSEILAGLQWWLRDVWLHTLKVGPDLVAFPSLSSHAESLARRLSPSAAIENVQVIEQTQRQLTTNVQEALTLEVGLLRLKM